MEQLIGALKVSSCACPAATDANTAPADVSTTRSSHTCDPAEEDAEENAVGKTPENRWRTFCETGRGAEDPVEAEGPSIINIILRAYTSSIPTALLAASAALLAAF